MGNRKYALRAATLLLPTFWCLFAAAQEPRREYLGAARLFSQEKVTIVYPAARNEDGEIHRILAERKAAYLKRGWNVEAEVVADDGVSAEQLRGNLLLLGWDNRLIGKPEAPAPYGVSGADRMFLGSIPVRAGEDLLFAAVSPYDPESWLFFWSRLDPERDRFLVMPFIGSDWVVYDDYLPIEQGMFSSPDNWPPVRNPQAERSRRDDVALPQRSRSGHYRIHSLFDEEESRRILERREQVLAEVVRQLGSPGDDFAVDLYVYKNETDKEEHTGVPAGSHSVAGHREIHMTQQMARSASPREEVNVVAAAVFGPCSLTAFYNGLATRVELPSGPAGLPLYAAMLVDQGALPRIEQLLDEEEIRRLLRERVGLPAAALLVGWVREVGGLDLLGRAYSSRGLDVARLAEWMGLSAAGAEQAFREWVGGVGATARDELAFREELERAREQRLMGDRAAEAEVLARALKHKPEDPETLYTLALALIESDQSREAERWLLRLVELSVAPQETRYVIFGYYQLGRAYENIGRLEKAQDAYRRMLDLPDEYDAHRTAREAIERLSGAGKDGESSPGN